MGMYLNPGNSGFEEIRNSRYVDKSGLISLVNRTIGTKQKLLWKVLCGADAVCIL